MESTNKQVFHFHIHRGAINDHLSVCNIKHFVWLYSPLYVHVSVSAQRNYERKVSYIKHWAKPLSIAFSPIYMRNRSRNILYKKFTSIFSEVEF
jgi:hypothetical protein